MAPVRSIRGAEAEALTARRIGWLAGGVSSQVMEFPSRFLYFLASWRHV